MTGPLTIALLTCILVMLSAVRRVPGGQAWTVHRFGRYVRTLQPGTHLVWPLVDRIARQVTLIGHHVALPMTLLGDADASADLYYQILDPMPAGGALESVDDMVLRQADEALHSIAAQLPQRPTAWSAPFGDALKVELNRRLGQMGLRVIRCGLHMS